VEELTSKDYFYEIWAQVIGWILLLFPVVVVEPSFIVMASKEKLNKDIIWPNVFKNLFTSTKGWMKKDFI